VALSLRVKVARPEKTSARSLARSASRRASAACSRLIERRLGDIEVAALDQLRHLPVEEGQQQRADVGAVDVGVGHDDDLVVAQLLDVEVVAADAGAERRDQRADLVWTPASCRSARARR
jgi:hypothetical protein